MPTNMTLVLADYRNGLSIEQIKVKYNLSDAELKTLNENIRKELGVNNSEQMPGSKEITLEDGTKVSAYLINTVRQPKGGFINVYSTQDYKNYYQYTDEDGNQQKITDSYNYLAACGDNIEAAWNQLQEGKYLKSLVTLLGGPENPRLSITGYAPGVTFTKGPSTIKTIKNFIEQLKKAKNFTQFKEIVMNIIKGSRSTANPNTAVKSRAISKTPLINNQVETTVAKLTKDGFNITNVKGALKATRTKFGKTTTHYINPKNGKIVKTVRDGNTGTLVTKAQKDGSYIHEYTCGRGGESVVVKYMGYSADGVPITTTTQSVEIIKTNLQTGKSVTTVLNNEQVARGLSYSQRYNDAIASSEFVKGMSLSPGATSMPSQDYNAISFLTPEGSLSSWGTPVIDEILFVCH